jgi:hypothetical protein
MTDLAESPFAADQARVAVLNRCSDCSPPPPSVAEEDEVLTAEKTLLMMSNDHAELAPSRFVERNLQCNPNLNKNDHCARRR